MQNTTERLKAYLPDSINSILSELNAAQRSALKEIRLRLQRPLMLNFGNEVKFYGKTTRPQIAHVIRKISDYSLNSVKNDILKGFVTIPGGIRVGISGEAVIKNGEITFLHNINGISFRIAREKKGVADGVIRDIYDGRNIFNTLVISPPMMGKTTLLRDIARLLSRSMNVCIIDERSEIAACMDSVPSFDVGDRTDIIDSAPKALAIPMAVRSLSPDVVLTDEIGTLDDCTALYDAAKSGVYFVASMHAGSCDDAIKKHFTARLFEDGTVKRLIVLGKNNIVGSISEIIKL